MLMVTALGSPHRWVGVVSASVALMACLAVSSARADSLTITPRASNLVSITEGGSTTLVFDLSFTGTTGTFYDFFYGQGGVLGGDATDGPTNSAHQPQDSP